ncbi:type VI secretion system membrane subunit TssM [Niveibacterium umoris]|uniref:Type VI secretion system protein ImpL n=1 Tax=Niveibacterium umoris TaxID=1193620 RepID=A0A840BJA1_9RHOO|nr:type VI secretion system membrane subunit TssM [Niveibacterium umoris]MBB4011672.1 type VI secretion system protein ImpL [Niveibacterium umoris]
MKSFFKALLHPVVLGLFGLIAFALVVWFIGPLIAIAGHAPLEPALVRWILIGLVVLFVVGRFAYRKWKASKANAQLLDGIAGHSAGEADSPEVQVLRQRFAEGVAVLKQSQLGADKKAGAFARLASIGSSRYLYELPWYVFIGAPGSGKTTALINSGLRFPLADKLGTHQIKGVGGTRNCDWWFTDEAVLIDTAGRYTTQDSDQSADRTAWQGFLGLLKKHRPRQPLNGVLLTVSIGDLLTQSEAAATAHAAALRTRIQELYTELGVRLPVYVLVTKADLIAGFMEFFGDLGKDARDQVWGTTFAPDVQGVPEALLSERLAGLQSRIDRVFLERLQTERDLMRRGLIAAFPQQFAAAGKLLRDFLDKVLAPSGFDHPLQVRGVYFTSGTQEGNPIDRVLASLGGAFGLERRVLPPQAGSGKSYFLTRLLREVVFAEQRLGGTNIKWERNRGLIRLAAFGAVALISLGLLLAWTLSYIGNSGYVGEVDAKVAALKPIVGDANKAPIDDILGVLPVIEGVKGVAHTASRPGGESPMSMGFGLGQGDKLDAAAEQAYRSLLRDTLMPRISNRVEAQLRGSLTTDNLEYTYEALKTYLMLNQPAHFNADALKAWIAFDWSRNLPQEATTDQRQALSAHVDALFADGAVLSPLPANAQLIADARNKLLGFSLPARVYSRLKRQGVGNDIPDFTIERAAGSSAALVFIRKSGQPLTKGVPGLYTYDGYYKGFDREVGRVSKQLAEEQAWVLGTESAKLGDAGKVSDDVRRLYLADYAKVWEEFLADVTLVKSGSLQQSIQVARVLSAPDSPLPKFLRAVSRETTLTKRAEDKTLVDKAGEKVSGAKQELGKMLGLGDAAPAAAPAGGGLEIMVDDRFTQVRSLVTGDGKTAPIDATIALLNEVYVNLTATETALRDKVAPPPGDTAVKVKAESARMPEPLRSMLQQLSAAGTSQALTATRENLSASVGAQVGQFCQQAIDGRYPFVKGSNRDVTREDFARLFSPGGLMDDFFQKNLAQFVDTSTRPWSFKKVQEQSLGGSGNLVQFQRAATIRDVFFRSGGSIRLDFKPTDMDPSITQFTLDVDGQLVKYAHGPQMLQSIQWPGTKGGLSARVQVAPAAASGNSGFSTEGPWALFRLFDKAKVDGLGAPEKFKVTFDVDGRTATFEVTASSVQNPFRLRELSEFRCPSGL